MSTKASRTCGNAPISTSIHLSFPHPYICVHLPPSTLFIVKGRAMEPRGCQRVMNEHFHLLFKRMIERGRGTIAGCVSLWRVPHHNGRLTSDDISRCTTRFLSWGISCQLVCYHAGSLCDPCYNWNKMQIASKTALPGLKPLSIHTTVTRRRCQ